MIPAPIADDLQVKESQNIKKGVGLGGLSALLLRDFGRLEHLRGASVATNL